MKKVLFVAFVLLASFFLVYNLFFSRKVVNSAKIKVVVCEVVEQNLYEKINIIGQAKLSNSRDFYSEVKGKVDEVTKIQGAKVSKGDIILIIEKSLAEKLKQQAIANLELAEMTYKGNLALLSKNIVNKELINKSKAALENAKNEYAKAIETYDNMVIKASQDGYLGVVRANKADEIKPGDYLFSIIEEGDFNIFVELPGNLRSKVTYKDIVRTTTEDGEVIEGKIVAISDYLSNTGGVTAKILLPFSRKISHGSYINLEIIYNAHMALTVPEKIIMQDNEGSFIYAITDKNIIKKIYIDLGIKCEKFVELKQNNTSIIEDLKSSKLVLEGLTKVKDGLVVEIIEQEDPKTKL
ncbi:MAG: efflux RND transporter periplasmic adaptor subunit [Rickettsiaceae bacterium]|nr:efflux RND transporter periplasmic adaptor subunit [Rickettsiaceae bacterium]